MNNVAVVPYIGMHALQIQNVKRNIVKKVSVDEINEEILRPAEVSTTPASQPDIPLSSESTSIDDLRIQIE